MPIRTLLLWIAVTVGAAGAAIAAPLWTYSVSLALFGLPHVLVELRYVDRAFAPRLGRTMVQGIVVGLAAIAVLRGLALLGVGAQVLRTQAELAVGAVLAVLVVRLAARPLSAAGSVSALVAVAVATGAVFAPVTTLVVFAFAHNLTPLGFLAFALRGPARVPVLVFAGLAFVLVPVLLVAGFSGTPGSVTLEGPPGLGPLEQHLGSFVPPVLQIEEIAVDLFAAAAYLQCMHYAVVLHVLPTLASEPPAGTRVAPHLLDLVGKGPALIALGVVATVGFACAFASTRAAYGVVAAVHAWVEVPVLIAACGATSVRREVAAA